MDIIYPQILMIFLKFSFLYIFCFLKLSFTIYFIDLISLSNIKYLEPISLKLGWSDFLREATSNILPGGWRPGHLCWRIQLGKRPKGASVHPTTIPWSSQLQGCALAFRFAVYFPEKIPSVLPFSDRNLQSFSGAGGDSHLVRQCGAGNQITALRHFMGCWEKLMDT